MPVTEVFKSNLVSSGKARSVQICLLVHSVSSGSAVQNVTW